MLSVCQCFIICLNFCRLPMFCLVNVFWYGEKIARGDDCFCWLLFLVVMFVGHCLWLILCLVDIVFV